MSYSRSMNELEDTLESDAPTRSARYYHLPESTDPLIDALMEGSGWNKDQAKRLAVPVLELSNHYHGKTEARSKFWSTKALLAGYFSYFFPLAYIRISSVIKEAQRLQFFEGFDSLVDFGSGAGTLDWVLHSLGLLDQFKDRTAVEINNDAIDKHQILTANLRISEPKWKNELPKPRSKQMGFFSFSLNELEAPPEEIFDFDGLVLIEPATHKEARNLERLRARLIERGFYMWGPCTHQAACPLLTRSKTDWCHDRVFFKRPLWFRNLENMVEIVNRSVTYSYLLARKDPPPFGITNINHKLARVVGDTLNEKGKTRQAVCRGPDREFLSWLKKEGKTPFIPHGALIETPVEYEVRGNELRIGDTYKLVPFTDEESN